MGRRALHNEGSELLQERLKDKIDVDFDTARRLFTLICVLHWKGLSAVAGRTVRRRVLFACGLNSVRSPMAAALFKHLFGRVVYVGSAGVRKGELDPFAVAAMDEIGLDIAKHRPMTFEELEDLEGLNFDLIVTLSPEAHHKALELTRTARASTWNTGRPPIPPSPRATASSGSTAYREVRDQLLRADQAAIRRRRPAGNE